MHIKKNMTIFFLISVSVSIYSWLPMPGAPPPIAPIIAKGLNGGTVPVPDEL